MLIVQVFLSFYIHPLCVCGGGDTTAFVWWSENSMWLSNFHFHYMDPEDLTQVLRVGS